MSQNYLTEPQFDENILGQGNSSRFQTQKSIEKFPVASLRLLNEAIKCQVMPAHLKDKLIRNPNKYSIFYTKFDCDSPTLKQALVNLNRSEEDLNTQSFQQFMKNQQIESLESIIQYFYYITQQYELLKEVIAEKNAIKKSLYLENQQQLQETWYLQSQGRLGDSSIMNQTTNLNNTTMRQQQHNRSIERLQLPLEDKIELLKEKMKSEYNKQKMIEEKNESRDNLLQTFNSKLLSYVEFKSQKARDLLVKQTLLKQKKKNEQIKSVLEKAQKEEENRINRQERRIEQKQRKKEIEYKKRLPQIEKEIEEQRLKKEKTYQYQQRALDIVHERDRQYDQKIEELLATHINREEKIEEFKQKQALRNRLKAEENSKHHRQIIDKHQQIRSFDSQDKLKGTMSKEMVGIERSEKKRVKDLQIKKKNINKYQEKVQQNQNNRKYNEERFQKFIDQTSDKIEYENRRYEQHQENQKELQLQQSVKKNDKVEKVQINYALQIMRNNQKQNKLLNSLNQKANKGDKIKFEKEALQNVHTTLRQALHHNDSVSTFDLMYKE